MMIALPLAELFDDLFPGMLSEGARVVLLLGGSTILLSGLATLWNVRRMLVELGHVQERPTVDAASTAFRSFRKSVTGADPNETNEVGLDLDSVEEETP